MGASAATLFDRFKAAYPKRPENGWAPARVQFDKLVKVGVDPEDLIRAASAYAAFTARTVADPKFIPMAKRWLAERRFEDFLEEAPASAGPSQPSPEPPAHPLAFLLEEMDLAAWRSWIEPLAVAGEPGAITITARTSIAADKVRREWGAQIQARLGDVAWRVNRNREAVRREGQA